ncbi:MAG: tripartite tricarboxylate transporter substrate binding protein [Rhizobiales bacterium]|nr:tripartite tricarboxylate transporter substrate binding protein [Hyphomicrobiales bacterium]
MLRHILSGLFALGLIIGDLQAEATYPTKPVRIIVPSSAGGGTDVIGRLLAQHLSTTMGQQFYVDNRPGAGSIIGTEVAARAAPDGYTLVMVASTLTTLHLMSKTLPFNPAKDLTPVTMAVMVPQVLVVHPSVPAKSIQELIALAKKEPGKLTFGSAGLSTAPHMAMELFKSMAGVDMLHVPSRGVAPSVTDLLGGRLSAMIVNLLVAKPHIEAGKLRPLAVTTTDRTDTLPDVPTISEAGLKGYDAPQWFGIMAPAGTPRPIVERIRQVIAEGLRKPEIAKHLATDGARPVANSPDEFAVVIQAEIDKWNAVARAANMKTN